MGNNAVVHLNSLGKLDSSFAKIYRVQADKTLKHNPISGIMCAYFDMETVLMTQNHDPYSDAQALVGLTLGKATDYQAEYDASLLQGFHAH
ncbi:hypothetical protein LFREDSHE_15570 [Shewanella baltica]